MTRQSASLSGSTDGSGTDNTPGSQTALVLVGPPAAGKSTVGDLLTGMSIPVCGTGEFVRREAQKRYDEPTEDQIWEVATSLRKASGVHAPTSLIGDWLTEHAEESLIAITGCRTDEEIEWLAARPTVSNVLVLQVNTSTRGERVDRYIESRMGVAEEGADLTKMGTLREEYRRRETRELPIPKHHATILNDDSKRTMELIEQIEGLVGAITV